MKQSLTKSNRSEVSARGAALQRVISVPAVIEDVRSAFFGLCVHAGKQVLAAMMEEDRTRLCGPAGRPDPDRRALRGGHTRSWVVLGGRRTPIRRARARAVVGDEMSLPSMVWASQADPLNAATLSAIAAGVSGRRYAGTLDALPPGCEERSISRSSVSRRFVALSAARLAEWLASPLGKLDLPVIMIDGIHFRGRVVLVALGVDAKGEKHVLALREGHSENATLVRALIADLVERGLDPETARLWVIDGAKALRRAIGEHFGNSALVQRCQIHKLRNVLGHLPNEIHASVRRAMNDAWHTENPALALKQLQRLAGSLARTRASGRGQLASRGDGGNADPWTPGHRWRALPHAADHQRHREPERLGRALHAQCPALARRPDAGPLDRRSTPRSAPRVPPTARLPRHPKVVRRAPERYAHLQIGTQSRVT